jgi:hypothetical protein
MDPLQPVPTVVKKGYENRHLVEKCRDCNTTVRSDRLESHWNTKHGKENNSPNPYAKVLK